MDTIDKFKTKILAFLCMAVMVIVTGCGGGDNGEGSEGSYTLSEIRMPQYSGAQTVASDVGEIDFSNANEGYIMAMYTGGAKAKLQVTKDEIKYNYDLLNTGAYEVFPLQMGDGTYTLKLMQNVSDDRYTAVLTQAIDVTLTSEFAPFLIPNQMVNYTPESQSVVFARDKAKDAKSDVDVVKAVYAYIKDNVVYDVKKAQSIQDGYIPVVDDTYATNKGICFDYASLAAAMLRSCGIPAMVQTGYVSPSGVYHAWNMVYLKDSGWVEVGFKADQNTWTQVDLTFAASSSKTDLSNFIGDNGTYETKYTY